MAQNGRVWIRATGIIRHVGSLLACSPHRRYWAEGFFFEETISAIIQHLQAAALGTPVIRG